MKGIREGIPGVLISLSKLSISISVSLSGITGYVIYTGHFTTGMLVPILGIFILSSGSSALNHYQERAFDTLMLRTKNRPIPSGSISPSKALFTSIVLLLTGSMLLYLSGIEPFLLGLLAVFWYNLVYTYLKRITAFAVVPGSLIGAIPPMIGWLAAGGALIDIKNLVLAFYFFLGQIPHFWLIVLKFGKEYETAGFKSLSQLLNKDQIQRLTFIWIVGVGVSSLLFPLVGIITSVILLTLLAVASIMLIYSFSKLVFNKAGSFRYGNAFLYLNLYFLFIMILLIMTVIPVF